MTRRVTGCPWPRRALSASAATHLGFGLILALHVLLSLGYGLNTPPFESPDEPGHYLFVRYLQAYGKLPIQTTEFMAPRAHHPPGYYWLGALLTRWVPIPGSPDALYGLVPNPKFGFRVADAVPDNKAVYIHNGPDERWPFQGQALAVHLIRLVSAAFAALAVAATYGAARQLRPGEAVFSLLVTSLVAFNPMVLFMSGVVNNDTAALAAGAVVFYLLTTFTRQGFTVARWAVVGTALALGLLLKTSALALLAPVGLVLLLQASPGGLRQLVRCGLALALPILLLAGWWYWRNLQVYGDLTGNAAVEIVTGRLPAGERFVDLPGKLWWMAKGVFGCGLIGPLSLCFADGVYIAVGIVAAVALAGLAAWAARRGRSLWTEPPVDGRTSRLSRWGAMLAYPSLQLWLMYTVALAATTGAALTIALTYQNCWAGRYLFPAFTPLALLLGAGALAWVRPRGRVWVLALLAGLSLAAAAFGLFGLLIPRYGVPRTASARELSQAVAVDAQVGGLARVVGYRIEQNATPAGGVVAVTVYWQPLTRTARPYTVFVHVFDASLGSLAQRDTYPGLGNYATTVWDPGRVFADTYRLYLPTDAPAVEGATILLGLYDETTGERLPVTGADAGPAQARWVQFGSVDLPP